MKKTLLTAALAVMALGASAQQNVYFQTACHPEDVKHYDTKTLRERFVMEKVMAADEINLTYSQYDRFIFGGAMPVNKELKLENFGSRTLRRQDNQRAILPLQPRAWHHQLRTGHRLRTR